MDDSRGSLLSKEEASCTAASFYLSFENDEDNDGLDELLRPQIESVAYNAPTINHEYNNTSTLSEMYKTLEAVDEEEEDGDVTPCIEKDSVQYNSTLENITQGVMLSPGRRLTSNGVSPFRSLTLPAHILREFPKSSTPSKFGQPGIEKFPENNVSGYHTMMTMEESDNKQQLDPNIDDDNKENISPYAAKEGKGKKGEASPTTPFKPARNGQPQPLQEVKGFATTEKDFSAVNVIKDLLVTQMMNNGGHPNIPSKIIDVKREIREILEENRVDKVERMLEKKSVEMKEALDEKKVAPQAKDDDGVDGAVRGMEELVVEENEEKKITDKVPKMVTIVEENEKNTSSVKSPVQMVKKFNTSRKSLLPTLKNTRNPPSTIKNEMVVASATTTTTTTSSMALTTSNDLDEIPQLIQRMLKISEEQKSNIIGGGNLRRTEKIVTMKKPLSSGGGGGRRASLIPSVNPMPEKKRYSFTNRMSTVLKTTLNSPARKAATLMTTTTVKSSASGTNNAKIPIKPRLSRNFGQKNTATTTSTNATNDDGGNAMVVGCPESVKKITKKNEFCCAICNAKFRIKSLYDAHRRGHDTIEPVTPSVNHPATSITTNFMESSSSSSTATTNSSIGRTPGATAAPPIRIMSSVPQCKYCDKKFALVRTLHIHLLQNCSKIPPSEKRKLQYTEMDHEEKAQLPKVFSATTTSIPTAVQQTKPSISGKQQSGMVAHKATTDGFNHATKRDGFSSRLTLGGEQPPTKMHVAPLLPEALPEHLATDNSGAQKATNKAHTGIYRTPSKAIVCHLCKLTFRSVLGFTQHNLSAHINNKAEEPTLDSKK